MTYKDSFIAEIKCNGKILRVRDGIVKLPFGSEYSIFLKNLSTRRAAVKISIDGQDVLDNKSLVLDAQQTNDLKGFLNDNVVENRFKFIQKTEQIQNHRGDRIDDGIVRVEFAFEKPLVVFGGNYYVNWNNPFHWDYNNNIKYGSYSGDNLNSRSICATVETRNTNIPLENEGITVKGSECSQSFNYSSMGTLDEANVIIIKLEGINSSGNNIEVPLTVKDKIFCRTCGTGCKTSFKFCYNCGTFLE